MHEIDKKLEDEKNFRMFFYCWILKTTSQIFSNNFLSNFPLSCILLRILIDQVYFYVTKCSNHQYLFEATSSRIRRENQLKDIKDKKEPIFTENNMTITQWKQNLRKKFTFLLFL